MPKLLVFDVNETLLDTNALAPHFKRAFGDSRVLKEWFSHLLLYSEACSLTDDYADFGTLAKAALSMIAVSHGIDLSSKDATAILEGMQSLPAWPEVPDALSRLRQAGYRLFALSNSAPKSLEQQLHTSGLAGYFERAFSVDEVRRYKPAPEPYIHVAVQLGVSPSDYRMIAAHAWDTFGALSAGCRAAFVARPGKALFPRGPQPDIIGADLKDVAAQILAAGG